MPRKPKIIYPELERWMRTSGMTPALLMQTLYLSPEGYRNRMHGRTQFSGLEAEKLEKLTGVPRGYLLRREDK